MKQSLKVGVLFFSLMMSSAGAKVDKSSLRFPWQAPTDAQMYCEMEGADFQKILENVDNRLSFENPPGYLRTNTCWWHSRFLRAATYLSVFRPELPRPTPEEASALIRQIMKRSTVVEIPGYSNLLEFSKAYEELFIKELSLWQLKEVFIKQVWIKGLIGKNSPPADRLALEMDRLYQAVHEEKRVVYQMLQIPGFSAHAWLVIGMEKTKEGYRLRVVNSNQNSSIEVDDYKLGDRSFKRKKGEATPYIREEDDFKRFQMAKEAYCARGGGGDW